MGWVSWPLYIFAFLASFSALWWPIIWPKMGFLELLEKTIGSIHFIPGIYPYGVSVLTPIHFRVPSLIVGPLVAKYLAENGVSRTEKKTIGSIHFIPGIYPYGVSLLNPIHICVLASFLALASGGQILGRKWGFRNFLKNYYIGFIYFFSWRIPTCIAQDCKIEIFIGYFWMRWVVIRAGVYCSHLWAQLVESINANAGIRYEWWQVMITSSPAKANTGALVC